MMALPDDEALAYLDGCAKSGEAVEASKIVSMSREEILGHFYKSVNYRRQGDGWAFDFDVESLTGSKLIRDLVDAEPKTVIARAGTQMPPRSLNNWAESPVTAVLICQSDLLGRVAAGYARHSNTGDRWHSSFC